jgi:hypothetical protein
MQPIPSGTGPPHINASDTGSESGDVALHSDAGLFPLQRIGRRPGSAKAGKAKSPRFEAGGFSVIQRKR